MKIAVIAANGRSGQAFVNKALSAGHTINAGVLGISHLPIHENLKIITCDATKEEEIEKLIEGQEVVVSLIGHVKGSQPDVQSVAIKKVIQAMDRRNLKRLISLTGTGVRFPGDHITLIDRFLNLSISIIDPNRVKDGIQHVEILKQSDLDWTVIRVLKLQNVKAKPFKLTEHGPTKNYVGREEVASAILEAIEQKSFIKNAPIISRP